MAMLDAGAKGKTQNQIKKGLFFPPSATLQAEYKIILPSITSTQDFTFETANKVFINRGFSLLDDFKEVMMNSFHSNWAKKFDKSFEMEFQISPDFSVDAPMMWKS